MERIFGEHHQIHACLIAPGLAHEVDHAGRLGGEVGLGFNVWQLQLHKADTDTFFRYIKAT